MVPILNYKEPSDIFVIRKLYPAGTTPIPLNDLLVIDQSHLFQGKGMDRTTLLITKNLTELIGQAPSWASKSDQKGKYSYAHFGVITLNAQHVVFRDMTIAFFKHPVPSHWGSLGYHAIHSNGSSWVWFINVRFVNCDNAVTGKYSNLFMRGCVFESEHPISVIVGHHAVSTFGHRQLFLENNHKGQWYHDFDISKDSKDIIWRKNRGVNLGITHHGSPTDQLPRQWFLDQNQAGVGNRFQNFGGSTSWTKNGHAGKGYLRGNLDSTGRLLKYASITHSPWYPTPRYWDVEHYEDLVNIDQQELWPLALKVGEARLEDPMPTEYSLMITAPQSGATVPVGMIDIVYQTNATLRVGDTHIAMQADNGPVMYLYNTKPYHFYASQGSHSINMWMVDGNHTPIGEKQTVKFQAQESHVNPPLTPAPEQEVFSQLKSGDITVLTTISGNIVSVRVDKGSELFKRFGVEVV